MDERVNAYKISVGSVEAIWKRNLLDARFRDVEWIYLAADRAGPMTRSRENDSEPSGSVTGRIYQ